MSDVVEPGPVTAVVPLRDGVSGKSRLAAALEPAARRRLVVTLAQHVLEVLAASPRLSRVVVVTADEPFAREVLAGAPSAGAGPVGTVIAEPPGRPGLNAALSHARAHVQNLGPAPGRLLVVHADLPLLTSDDVAAVLDARADGDGDGDTADGEAPADVVVATDRHGTGTNLLVLPADAAFTFRFGPGSRAAHVAEARTRGLGCAVVQRPGTALDLDTLDDLDDLHAAVRTWHGQSGATP